MKPDICPGIQQSRDSYVDGSNTARLWLTFWSNGCHIEGREDVNAKELKEEYWPRLLKDSKKMHFLKTNFDKVRQ